MQRAILDIGMLAACARHRDAPGIFLEFLCKRRDRLGHGRRKHQGTAVLRRAPQDEFQILTKPEVEHFIGFIQNDSAHGAHVQRTAHDMVAQAPRGADDEMGAPIEGAAFFTHVHAAHAGCHTGSGSFVKPAKLALDLHGQFACGGDYQGKGGTRRAEPILAVKDGRRNGHPEPYGLARPGLRRHEQIGTGKVRLGHGQLDRGQHVIATHRKGFGQRCDHRGHLGHGGVFQNWRNRPGETLRTAQQAIGGGR